jgi:hypothetical protein
MNRATADWPRYIVWSVDRVNTTDPFQRRWLLRQILLHGRAQDIRLLDLAEVERDLDSLGLPPDLYRLWHNYLRARHAGK